jgi:hypothetical protein
MNVIFKLSPPFFKNNSVPVCLTTSASLCQKGSIYVVNSFHPLAMKRRKVILGKFYDTLNERVTERSCQICLENKLL